MSAASKSAPLGPVEIADARVRQQRALLEDARARREKASSARAARERDLETAERRKSEALAASAADRSSSELLDEAARSDVRRLHAVSDHAAAVKAFDDVDAEVREREGHVAAAERDHEIATLTAKLDDPARAESARARASSAFEHIIALAECMRAHREQLAEDAATVERIHELGGPASVRVPDGTREAGAFATALHDAGGIVFGNPHAMRWPWQAPSTMIPDPDASGAALKLATAALEALAQGAVRDPDHHGRAELARYGEVWSKHRTHLEASVELDALAKADADRNVAVAQTAHEARLRAAHAAAHRKPKGAENAWRVIEHGRTGAPPSPPRRPPPGAVAEGEFTYGDDVGSAEKLSGVE